MTSINTYKEEYIPYPFGLTNSGAICYFNSLLQSLLSCSSFNEIVLNDKKLATNNVINNYITILKFGLDNTNANTVYKGSAHLQMIQIIKRLQSKSTNKIKFGDGQQDVDEGLKLLIDAINNKKIIEIFQMRYRGFIYCKSCKYTHQSAPDIGDPNFTIELSLTLFDNIPENKHASIIQKYILHHNEYIDNNYICPNCNITGNQLKIAKLSMVPEIIILLFKKFQKIGPSTTAIKKNINFPHQLQFNNGAMKFRIVSQCEHSGGINGGHYYAISQRKSEIYNLNDTSCHITNNFISSANTYLVFYHII